MGPVTQPMAALLVEHVTHFQHRVIQDALNEATATYWRRRAVTFDQAAPRCTDFTGNATPAQIQAQRDRAQQCAEACRHRADLALLEQWEVGS